MLSKIATVFGALFVSSTNAFKPGVNAGLAMTVLEQGKNKYFNAVMEKINGI